MYVNTKVILEKAHKEGFGVAALNINNLEFLQAIIESGVEKKSPVIIQTSQGALKYAGDGDVFRGARLFVKMTREFADSVDIPVALHLDHGSKLDNIMACIQAGYSSVMIDASHHNFEENMAITKKIVEIAHNANISVEAELGQLAGIEDDVQAEHSVLVDPMEAKQFVETTGVDFLAPAIGTSHGAFKFKGEAKLDFDRLAKVKELTGIPLVLHGASSVVPKFVEIAESYGADFGGSKGVPADVLKQCVQGGISKVNTDTDLRMAFVAGLREYLTKNPKEFDPRNYFKTAKEYVKEVIEDRMEVLGSVGKA
ncbi:MAG TPA: class II fructose-1,6-bisphosphate aldolase [Tepiditoga sp.]|nr:class II fructose-1,6-bisphosphate aldolase [Tepiditoga sp.]